MERRSDNVTRAFVDAVQAVLVVNKDCVNAMMNLFEWGFSYYEARRIVEQSEVQ